MCLVPWSRLDTAQLWMTYPCFITDAMKIALHLYLAFSVQRPLFQKLTLVVYISDHVIPIPTPDDFSSCTTCSGSREIFKPLRIVLLLELLPRRENAGFEIIIGGVCSFGINIIIFAIIQIDKYSRSRSFLIPVATCEAFCMIQSVSR